MCSFNMNNKSNYCKDTVFDVFDIKEYFSKEITITPTNESNFIYKNDLHKHKIKESNNSIYDIYKLINRNHFGIRIEHLEIEKPNEYPSKFIDHYTPLNLIGQGSFGLVISVIKKDTQQKMAVKIIKKNYNLFDSLALEKEVTIFKALQNNPYTIKLYDVIDTNEYLFMFMDLIEGGSLKDFILERYKRSIKDTNNVFCTDNEVRIIITGILKAIQFLHKNNVMHRDLKPENILFRNKNDLTSIVIGDFGIADDSSRGLSINNKCGTLIYMAPEILTDRPYDQLVDSWACGIVLYILESGGRHPIYMQGMNKSEYMKKLKEQKEWNFNIGFPNLARNFFLKLCKYESCARYHTHKALKHPWINASNDITTHSCSIPLTFIEEYNRNDKISKFKNMLTCSIFFNIFKTNNENLFLNRKSRTATYNFIFPLETPKLRKKSSSIHIKGTTTKKIIEYNHNAPSKKNNNSIFNTNKNTSTDNTNNNNNNSNYKEIKQHSQYKDKSFSIEHPSNLLKLKRNGSTGVIKNLFTKDKLILNNEIFKQQSIKNMSVLIKDKNYLSSFGCKCTKGQIKEEEKNAVVNESIKCCKKGNVVYPMICKKNGNSNLKKYNNLLLKDSSYIVANNYKRKKIKLLVGKSAVNSFNIGH